MSDLSKIKDTIRAMLNLARDDAAADGEIRNAMAFAQKLMDQHNLSEGDLGADGDGELDLERAEFDRQRANIDSTKVGFWEGQLGMFVCRFIGGVQCYQDFAKPIRNAVGGVKLDHRGVPKVAAGMMFYGIAEEAALAVDLYNELRVTIASMAKLRFGGVYRGKGREYCEGFVSGLSSKLSESKREQRQIAESDASGRQNALIVKRNEIVAAKTKAASAWLSEECGVKLRSSGNGGGGSFDPDARWQGRRDGAAHDTQTNRRRKLGHSAS